MTKNILVLVGSPRHNGNTELLADAFINGAADEGNKVTKYVLQGKNILPCIDCQACFKTGKCILRDDMNEVYELLSSANILVLASPVYFYGVSAQLKALLDRLHNPVRDTFPIKSSVFLSVCADNAEAFIPSIAMYKAIGRYLGWEDKGIVTACNVESKGDIAGRAELNLAYELGRQVGK
jgi:NAD(P)H-dependent FMN reductase